MSPDLSAIAWSSLNGVDYAILAVLLLSVFISLFRGFIREAVSLATWLLAIVIGFKYANEVSPRLESLVPSPDMRYWIAFIIVFLGVLILGIIVNVIVKKILHKSAFGVVDRLLGIIFGAARGVLVVALLLLFVSISPIQKDARMKASQLSPHFQGVVTWLNEFLPKTMTNITEWTDKHKQEKAGNDSQASNPNSDSDVDSAQSDDTQTGDIGQDETIKTVPDQPNSSESQSKPSNVNIPAQEGSTQDQNTSEQGTQGNSVAQLGTQSGHAVPSSSFE